MSCFNSFLQTQHVFQELDCHSILANSGFIALQPGDPGSRRPRWKHDPQGCLYIHIHSIYMSIPVLSVFLTVFEHSCRLTGTRLFNHKQPHPAEPAGTALSPLLPLCAAHQLYTQPSDCPIVLRLAVCHSRMWQTISSYCYHGRAKHTVLWCLVFHVKKIE